MNPIFHPIGPIFLAIAGLLLLYGFFNSIVRVALLNRHRREPLAQIIGMLAYRFLYVKPWDEKHHSDRDRRLWFLPLYAILLVASWVGIVILAYTCFFLASDSEPTFLKAIISSGSSISTLGFNTPAAPQGGILAISEGIIGLFIVVFLLSFLPGYLATVQTRDQQVTWLYARTGAAPTGSKLINWHYCNNLGEELNGIWGTWESWFINLGMTIDLSPETALVPPFTPGQSWICASAVILDAASVACSAIDMNGATANICYEAGVKALKLVVASSFWPKPKPSLVVSYTRFTRADFEAAYDQLSRTGVKMNPNRDEAWSDFAKRLLQYENLVLKIGRAAHARFVLETKWTDLPPTKL